MGFFSDLFESDSETNSNTEGSSTTTFNERAESAQRLEPYGPAIDSINQLLEQVGALSGQEFAPFSGDRIADMTPEQIEGLDRLYDFATGEAGDIQGMFGDVGGELLGGVSGDMADARGYYGDMVDVAGRDPIAPNQIDMDYVRSIAENPFMDEMIDSALRDSSRNFRESVLPGITADAARTGNLGSSRRGAYEAIAERGDMDRAADVAAQMRGTAYDRGLSLGDANVGREFQGELAQRGDLLTALSQAAGGSAGLAGMGLEGAPLMQVAYEMGIRNPSLISGIGDVYQRQNQAEIGGEMAEYTEGQFLPIQQAANLMDIAMAPGVAFGETSMNSSASGVTEEEFEQSSRSETTSRPSPISRIGQLASIGGQIAGMGAGMGMGGMGGMFGSSAGAAGAGGGFNMPMIQSGIGQAFNTGMGAYGGNFGSTTAALAGQDPRTTAMLAGG